MAEPVKVTHEAGQSPIVQVVDPDQDQNQDQHVPPLDPQQQEQHEEPDPPPPTLVHQITIDDVGNLILVAAEVNFSNI